MAFKILGIKNNKAEEFVKAGIVVKAIRINNNNTIKEHMSFPTFKFKEIINEEWEDSKFRNYLSETKFFFIIYKYDAKGVLRLKGCQFWNMPLSDLDNSVKVVWQSAKNSILDESSFVFDGKFYRSSLPKPSENPISHVRPHGTNSKISVNPLPSGMMFPNQCFWLNNSYILSQIDESIYID